MILECWAGPPLLRGRGRTRPAGERGGEHEIDAARRGRGAGKPAPIHLAAFLFVPHLWPEAKENVMAAESESKLDYGALLSDLEAKKAVLDQAIASIRAAMAAGALGATEGMSYVKLAGTLVTPSLHNGEVPTGAFLGKNIPDATRLYLSIVKKKQTSQEIAQALRDGGMETASKNFEGMVHSILTRASKKNSAEIVKVGRAWALAEWYPAGIRAAVVQEKKTRKAKRGRSRKAEKAVIEPKTTPAPELNTSKDKGELIAEFLRKNPNRAYSRQEVCDALKIDARGLHVIFPKLVRRKVAEEVEAGKYRAA